MTREISLENVEILYGVCQSENAGFPRALGGATSANLQSMTAKEHFHFPYGKALELQRHSPRIQSNRDNNVI